MRFNPAIFSLPKVETPICKVICLKELLKKKEKKYSHDGDFRQWPQW